MVAKRRVVYYRALVHMQTTLRDYLPFSARKLCTLIPPPSSAPCEAGEATTCTLSVAHGLGATRRSSGAFSAST